MESPVRGDAKSPDLARPAPFLLRVLLIGGGKDVHRSLAASLPDSIAVVGIDPYYWDLRSHDRDGRIDRLFGGSDLVVIYAKGSDSLLMPSLFVGLARGKGKKVVSVFEPPVNRYINNVEAFADHCLASLDDLKEFLVGYLEREGVASGEVKEAVSNPDNIPAPTPPDFAGNSSIRITGSADLTTAGYSTITPFGADKSAQISPARFREHEQILDGAYPSFGESGPSRMNPPIGVIPRAIWQEQRASELSRAIHEYISGGFIGGSHKDSLRHWLNELQSLLPQIGRPAIPDEIVPID